MNAETMTINPNELVIDLPVDNAHVQELMDSLQKNGRMVEPVTVWLQGMRIVNGFHRTEAAKRLGWVSMPCLIQDLTEDEFWDARIIAAKPHKEVEPARMAAWMMESWESTWGKTAIDTDELAGLLNKLGITECPSDKQLRMYALIDSLSEYETDDEFHRRIATREQVIDGFNKRGKPKVRTNIVWTKRDANELELWFDEKSKKWGVSVETAMRNIVTVARHMLGIAIDIYDIQSSYWKKGDKLPVFVAKVQAQKTYKPYTSQWANAVLAGTASVDDLESYAAAEKAKREADEKRQDEINRLAQERWELEREERFSRSAKMISDAQALYERERSSTPGRYKQLREMFNGVRVNLANLNIKDIPEAPAMIAEFAQFVADFAAKQFPDVQVAQPNPVALENSRLRAENARLKERVASLERALGSKQAAGEMLSNAMAWSSGDIER